MQTHKVWHGTCGRGAIANSLKKCISTRKSHCGGEACLGQERAPGRGAPKQKLADPPFLGLGYWQCNSFHSGALLPVLPKVYVKCTAHTPASVCCGIQL